jgi:Flp pilus assembly protein TadG
MRTFRQFKSDCLGNVTVMLALSVIPILITVGAAVDMVQTNNTLTKLQGAADAAAIAGGSSHITDDAGLQKIVEDYLRLNGAIAALDSVDKITPKLDKKKQTFSVTITGKRKTSLMNLAGIYDMDLRAYSQVNLGGDGLEVALVLDNTGSMNASGRLPALKTAAKLLVSEVMKTKDTGAYVRVGVVPFSNYVNVGLSQRKAPWLDVEDDKSVTVPHACWNTYPDAIKKNCHQVPNVVDGVSQGTTEQCDWDYGPPKEVCGPSTSTYTWNGCVGSRPDPMDEGIGGMSTHYKGLPNEWCASELMELTDNKSKLDDMIDNLVAVGETYIPAGLLWGWNMLDSNAPLEKAKTATAIKDMGGTKAIVLMTDGQNTLASYAPNHTGYAGTSDWAKGDAKTATLCKNIKDDKIVVYTVSFMITDPGAKSLMANCASDPSKAYTADSAAALASAFEDIGQSLVAMRLSK